MISHYWENWLQLLISPPRACGHFLWEDDEATLGSRVHSWDLLLRCPFTPQRRLSIKVWEIDILAKYKHTSPLWIKEICFLVFFLFSPRDHHSVTIKLVYRPLLPIIDLMFAVSVFSGCPNQLPQLWWLKKIRNIFSLNSRSTRSLKSRCWQGWFLLRVFSMSLS